MLIQITFFFFQYRYTYIVRYKTAYYSFYLPVALGMIISGISSEQTYINIKKILLEIGECYQIQDDYIDCYGDPSKTGKIGTDIEDGKCTWFIVKALELCNDSQKKVLLDNYAKKDPVNVKAVLQIYNELDLKSVYLREETLRLDLINDAIAKTVDKDYCLSLVLKTIMEIITHRSS